MTNRLLEYATIVFAALAWLALYVATPYQPPLAPAHDVPRRCTTAAGGGTPWSSTETTRPLQPDRGCSPVAGGATTFEEAP